MSILIDPFVRGAVKTTGMESDGCQWSQGLNRGHEDCATASDSQNFPTEIGQQIKLFERMVKIKYSNHVAGLEWPRGFQ